MNRFKKAALLVAIIFAAATPLAIGTSVYAVDQGAKDAACQGLGAVGTNCKDAGASSGISGLIASVVNILSWVVGIAAVIMIIVGGLKYVISGGDSNSISSAKNTIIYAIVGLVIALLAQGLVRFVLRSSTSTPAKEPSGAVELVE